MDSRLVVIGITLLICTGVAFFTTYQSETDISPIASSESPRQWQLPGYLHEASGLAILGPNQLLVHDDEKGNIYRVSIKSDPTDGIIIDKQFTIGFPPISRDFEGIAINGDVVYLVTSKGELLIVEGLVATQSNQRLSATELDTGLGKVCEIEGLHYDQGKLLIPCKVPLTNTHKDKLVVFALDSATGEREIYLSIPRSELTGAGKLKPTAIDTHNGHDYIISTNRLIVIDKTEQPLKVSLYKLPKKTHFQPEGIAVFEDGSIYIVDDNRRGLARMTYYSGLEDLKQLPP